MELLRLIIDTFDWLIDLHGPKLRKSDPIGELGENATDRMTNHRVILTPRVLPLIRL